MGKQSIIVSSFRNALDINPKDVSLLKWLEGNQRLNHLVDQIRNEPNKDQRSELKKKLPAITPSGKFKTRKADGIIKHSGYIALDFDNCNPAEAKQTLGAIVNVFYAGLSVSGQGLWALIPIKYPEYHKRHYEALKADFDGLGLEIDSACKDVCRLRFYSYDRDPVFNLDAVIYNKLAPEPVYQQTFQPIGNEGALDLLIQKIVSSGKDITIDYLDWVKIGGTLASIYGERGRDKFHLISQFYPAYSPRETDKQFNVCLRNPPGFGPAMIFSIAKRFGMYLKEDHS